MTAVVRRSPAGWMHRCPGCGGSHIIPETAGRLGWEFNGDLDRPTFSPSVKHTWGPWGDDFAIDGDARQPKVCHYFIRAGKIEFCDDSTHALAGQTVALPPIELTDETEVAS